MNKIQQLREALKHPSNMKQAEMPKRMLTDRELKQAEEALAIIRKIIGKGKTIEVKD